MNSRISHWFRQRASANFSRMNVMRQTLLTAAWIAIGLLLVLACPSVQAFDLPETPRWTPYTALDGLPSQRVYAVVEDQSGYLWVGTADGLARFDGDQFKVYQHLPNDPNSLPSNEVQALHVDAANRLWIGTQGGGLAMLPPERDRFVRLPEQAKQVLIGKDVWAITSIGNDLLFSGFNQGLVRWNHDTQTIDVLDASEHPTLLSNHGVSLARDGQTIWLGTAKGLVKINDHRPQSIEAVAGFEGKTVVALTPSPQGLWVGCKGGLFLHTPDGEVQEIKDTNNQALKQSTAIHAEASGRIWVVANGRLLYGEAGDLRLIEHSMGTILDISPDSQGSVWFASYGGGLQRLPVHWRNFTQIRTYPKTTAVDNLETLKIIGSNVSAVRARKAGGLWILSERGGLDVLDDDQLIFRLLDADDLPDQRLKSLLELDNGHVFIGDQTGLTRFTPANQAIKRWGLNDDDAPPGQVIDLLLPDGQGGFWLAAQGSGVQHRDGQGNVLATYLPPLNDGFDPSIDQLTKLTDGRLRLATASGVYVQTEANKNQWQQPCGLPKDRIFSLLPSQDGLWLHHLAGLKHAVWEDGCWHIDRRLDAGTAGMPAVESAGIVMDENEHLWLPTRRGLLEITPSLTTHLYSQRDGLMSNEFDMRPPWQGEGGTIAAALQRGLMLFQPQHMQHTKANSSLIIEDIRVRRKQTEQSIGSADGTITLTHHDRDLSIHARLLSFDDTKRHQYRYRFSSSDDRAWRSQQGSGTLTFPYLPPGVHRLEISAASSRGAWTPAQTLRIHMAPPWWRTWWAYICFALLAITLLGLLAWDARRRLKRGYQLRLAEKKRQLAEQHSEAKSAFLAMMGHEIRTPMTGVLGMAELLQKEPLNDAAKTKLSTIERSGKLMLRIINDALDLARIEAGKLNIDTQDVTLSHLLQDIQETIEPLAHSQGLGFHIERSPTVPEHIHGDALRIKQIIFNLCHNALKFTEQGHIKLLLTSEQNELRFHVQDTGQGMSEQQQKLLFQRFSQTDVKAYRQQASSGLGLAICAELAELMHGRMSVQSTPNHGTTLTLHLPITSSGQSHALMHDDAKHHEPTSTKQPAFTGQSVLLVEDDPITADVLQQHLRSFGLHVRHAGNALEAMAAVQTQQPDIILIDLDLPEVNGFSLRNMLAHTASTHIAITASGEPDIEQKCLNAGFHGFSRKPITVSQLINVIQVSVEVHHKVTSSGN